MTRSHPLLLALAATAAVATPLAAMPGAEAWEIGPFIRGRSYSEGMPAQPDPARGGGLAFDIPTAGRGHVHYLTAPSGSLAEARRITIRYRIDAPRGTRFVPVQHPGETATLSLYFQQRGDNWSGKGRYETYRWYSPDRATVPLTPGEHTLAVGLDEPWISVWGRTPDAAPGGFGAALANAGRVGFVLGSRSGRGHGVYATAPARFTLLDFEVR